MARQDRIHLRLGRGARGAAVVHQRLRRARDEDELVEHVRRVLALLEAELPEARLAAARRLWMRESSPSAQADVSIRAHGYQSPWLRILHCASLPVDVQDERLDAPPALDGRGGQLDA